MDYLSLIDVGITIINSENVTDRQKYLNFEI